MSDRHLPIEQTEFFKRYVFVANQVWEMCAGWSWFAQSTVGTQLARAIDSIGSNLVEGDGRYSEAEALHFFSIARGSSRETVYWLNRALDRNLINEATAKVLLEKLDHSGRALNNLISYRRRSKVPMTRESLADYGVPVGGGSSHERGSEGGAHNRQARSSEDRQGTPNEATRRRARSPMGPNDPEGRGRNAEGQTSFTEEIN